MLHSLKKRRLTALLLLLSAWLYVQPLAAQNKMLKKINELIKDIMRTPFEGIGKPEPLKYDLAGFWSRRIDREHRLVYQYVEGEVLIYSCRYHYD